MRAKRGPGTQGRTAARLLVVGIAIAAVGAGFALGRVGGPPAGAAERAAGQADPRASASLELAEDASVVVRWKARAWDAEWASSLRQDPEKRRLINATLSAQLDIQLSTPIPLQVAGEKLEPGTYRLALRMDDGGAFLVQLLVDTRFVDLGALPFEDERRLSHLDLSLLPSPRGRFVLRWQWGPEWAEAVFYGLD